MNPNDDLVIFDAQSTVGGTWAEERLYADLKTNNLYGTYEYPGFPMSSDPAMGKQHIPGTTVHEYLKSYVSSVAIDHLIQLNTRVTITEHQSTGGWVLTVVKTTSKVPINCLICWAVRLIIDASIIRRNSLFLPNISLWLPGSPQSRSCLPSPARRHSMARCFMVSISWRTAILFEL